MTRKDLVKGLEIEGVKLTIAQKEDFINQYETAIAQAVSEGEKVKTGLGTYSKKHKNERVNAERTVTLHGVERKIEASVTPEKDILGFKTKIEF